MSLILDALKRAEQERKLGQPPEAVQVATMSPIASSGPARDRTLVIVMAVLLLAAAIVIAALLLRPHAPAIADNVPPVPPHLPAQALRPIPPPPAPHPTAAPAPNAIADHSNVSNLDDVVAADDGKAENAQAAQVAEENLPSQPIAIAPHSIPARRPKPAANPPVAVTSDTPGAVVDDSSTADTSASDNAPPPPTATALRDMPEGYRDNFPQLTIDVHVYDDNPEHRFLIIGGNTYHEGNSLPQGPRIEAITQDGVVFEYQGQRVLYGLGSGN